jgi:hypothetical protein
MTDLAIWRPTRSVRALRIPTGAGPVSGSVAWMYVNDDDATCLQSVTGTLTTTGSLILYVADDLSDGCGAYDEQYMVLNSGDATSQGYFMDWGGTFPLSGFPNDLGDWYSPDVPLFKSQTDIPGSETPVFRAWVSTSYLSNSYTLSAWGRLLPPSTDNLVMFAGRFVFEQTASQGAVDGCYFAAISKDISYTDIPWAAASGVIGGGWYVDGSGKWGFNPDLTWADQLGYHTNEVQWIQNNGLAPCTLTLYQSMFIDTVSRPSSYITNTLTTEVDAAQVCQTVNSAVPICKPYPPAQ